MDLSSVDVRDFLSALDIRNIIDSGDEIQFSCPFPGHSFGDEHPSAYMNTETTAFFCHGCKSKGNAIHFLAKLEGISPLLAARHIRERYGSEFLDTQSFSLELDTVLVSNLAPSEDQDSHTYREIQYSLERLPKLSLEYLHGRGFCGAAISEWGLGYDPISDRIAIPVRDEEGTLIGFKGRAYRPEHKPRYLVLGDRPKRQKRYGFPTYEISEVVFGLDKFIQEAPTYDHHLIIVEGELDVIALWQSGIKNSASCGSNFSSTHRELITAWANSVTLFLDDDPAGNRASEKITKALSPYMPVRIVGPHEGDAASLTSEQCCKLIGEAETYDTIQITQD